ncbi:diadenylate cyclase CdaA [candidate division KSB1 bacterium]|nr:diadenylate cyclase CdaA [candidate division KSB1 bacterium]
MTLFKIGFIPVTVMDILDIFIIAYILLRLYYYLRGSRAAQMLVGLMIILILSVLAPFLQLRGISWILQNLRTVWLVAFVILFQPELRRILISVGQSRVISYFIKVSGNKMIDEVISATLQLRERGYGALIVMGRETGLRNVLETGVRIQAEVSAPLIVSVFNPRSPLHDGAIVIQNDLIVAAKCILPLVEDTGTFTSFGTRHRAALGLSEESDAIIIVISEETGRISLAEAGEFRFNLSEETLRRDLQQAFGQAVERKE